jgi:putative oxidoreductase
MFDRFAAYEPQMRSILRIVTGLLLLQHGTQKLLGFPDPTKGPIESFASLMGLAGTIEFVGGILLIIGLFTRPVAFICAGFTAVAYWMAHAPQGFWPALNQGELAIMFCFVFLYFVTAGAGPWSIDKR